MKYVFISHAHEDVDFANSVIVELQRAGFNHWIDSEQIGLGDDWRQRIDDAIKQAFALVVLITPNAQMSDYVTYEWIFALGLGLKVIPVIFSPTPLHLKMQMMNCLDFTAPVGRRWDMLIQELNKARLEGVDQEISVAEDAPSRVKYLVSKVDSLAADERASALEKLSHLNYSGFEEILKQAINHSFADVRIWASLKLAQLTDFRAKEAIPGLLEAICIVNSRVGEIAEGFLKKYAEDALPALRVLLQHEDWRIRVSGVEIASHIETEDKIHILSQALNDANHHVQHQAAEALEELGTPEALAAVAAWRKQNAK